MRAEVLVDWLTFSVKGMQPLDVIQHMLCMDSSLFVDAGFGLMGYTRVFRFSDIFVCYEPRENDFFHDMGVCVSMSGNGCRTFERFTSLSSPFVDLFALIVDHDCNVSRIDVACDDRSFVLDMDVIVHKVQSNEINSRMTARSVVVSWDGSHQSGSTVYIGSPTSSFRVRIYDKALEQGSEGHWVRVELVLRGEHALAFVRSVVCVDDCRRRVAELAALVLNDKLSFIERDDTNISRCTVCDWWRDFVQEVGKCHLVSRMDVQHPVYRVDQWVRDQVAPSLCLLVDTLGMSHVFEVIEASRDRLSPRQRSLVDDFNLLFDGSEGVISSFAK